MLVSAVRTRLLPAFARATSRPALAGANRLLILQPDHLGDILLSEPAVRLLRARLPDTELIAVVGPWSAEITRMSWQVDEIIEVDFPAFTRQHGSRNRATPYDLLRQEIRRLRKFGADDAIVLRDDAWWAAWLARGAVGGDVITSPDERSAAFATIKAQPSKATHRTAIAMEIVKTLLSLRGIDDLDVQWDMSPHLRPGWHDNAASSTLSRPTSGGKPLVVIHPGSGAPVKSWPERAWRRVARELADCDVFLTGSPAERDLCDAIALGLGHVTVVAGETSLTELASLLEAAAVAVGTDNGPMHLAGAVGTRTVRLFGPSNPDHYGPWPGTPDQAVLSAGWSCPRCEDLSAARRPGCGCMSAISLDIVVKHVRKLLEDAA